MMLNRFRILLLALGCASLTACDSVGEGNGLLRLEIRIPGAEGTPGQADYLGVAYECLIRSTELFGVFTNGSSGSFRSRATWRSSDESVLRVSNGDIPIEDGTGDNYARGVLLPVSPGRATITAEYVGLSHSVEVEVRTPDNLFLDRMVEVMAALTQEVFDLRVVLEGQEVSASPNTVWSVNVEPEVAFVNLNGVVVVNEPSDTPMTLTASLPLCADNAALGNGIRTQDIRLEVPSDLTIEAEFDPDTAGGPAPMMRNTTQLFTATAQFSGGGSQLLSNQPNLRWTSNNPEVASFGAPLQGLITGLFESEEGGPISAQVEVSAELDTADGDDPNRSASSTPALVEVFDLPLTDFSIAPETATIESAGQQQYTATGDFGDGQRTQDITRDVTWVSDPLTSVAISNALANRGLARSIRFEIEQQEVEILATAAISGVNESRTATLTVNPVACSDGVDNDGDTLVDFNEDETLGDPGCESEFDTDESDA